MRVVCKDCDVVMKMYRKTRYECPKCEIYIAIYPGDEE